MNLIQRIQYKTDSDQTSCNNLSFTIATKSVKAGFGSARQMPVDLKNIKLSEQWQCLHSFSRIAVECTSYLQQFTMFSKRQNLTFTKLTVLKVEPFDVFGPPQKLFKKITFVKKPVIELTFFMKKRTRPDIYRLQQIKFRIKTVLKVIFVTEL